MEWDVTRDWLKLREECLGFGEKRKVRTFREKLYRLWNQNKQLSQEYISLAEVHKKLSNSFMLSKAVDFIAFFGVSGVAWCCPHCMELPTNPKMWARYLKAKQNIADLAERLLALEEEANTPGVSSNRAKWHCPGDHCMRMHKQGQPGSRVFFHH